MYFLSSTFDGLTSLTEFLLDHNELFLDEKKTIWYNVSDHYQHKITELAVFANLSSLLHLDLGNNRFGANSQTGKFYLEAPYFVLSQKCRILNLTRNKFKYFTWHSNYSQNIYIDLTFNEIEVLILTSNGKMQKKTFDLRHNDIKSIRVVPPLGPSDFIGTNNQTNILLDHNPLICDGNQFYYLFNLWNQNVLKLDFGMQKCELPISLHGRFIKDLKLDEIDSGLSLDCYDGCDCSKLLKHRKELVANCSYRHRTHFPNIAKLYVSYRFKMDSLKLILEHNQLESLPDNTKFQTEIRTEIFAAHNAIKDLSEDNFHKDIYLLDIQNNNLQRVSSQVLEKFKTIKNLSLSGNPWICDCLSKDFFEFVQQSRQLINDYESIACDDGRLFKDVNLLDICFELVYKITIVLTILAALAMIVALFFKYKKLIKIWVFDHNICPWLVSEYDLDNNKIYDAFVMFASPDQEIVEDIVENLESGRTPYKCCVGVRDWSPGNMLADLVKNESDAIFSFVNNHILTFNVSDNTINRAVSSRHYFSIASFRRI